MADQNLTLRVSDVTVDEAVYPRGKVDSLNVSGLVDAIIVGKTLPPILVATRVDGVEVRNILVDGRHRLTAYKRAYDDHAEVHAIGREYATMADLFEEAIALNAAHGRKLGHHDSARIVVKAEELGISLERVADLLSVPPDKLRRRPIMAKPTAHTPGLAAASTVLLKRDFAHLEGQTLTAEQIQANERAAGAAAFHARQLSMRIASDTVNLEDARLRRTLVRLRDQLAELPLDAPVL